MSIDTLFIGIPLWIIAFRILFVINMKDVDRAKVYSEHLGKKLSK
jgi:hypothetical protein